MVKDALESVYMYIPIEKTKFVFSDLRGTSSPPPTNGAQDLHENLLSIGDAAFPGLSNQNELN